VASYSLSDNHAVSEGKERKGGTIQAVRKVERLVLHHDSTSRKKKVGNKHHRPDRSPKEGEKKKKEPVFPQNAIWRACGEEEKKKERGRKMRSHFPIPTVEKRERGGDRMRTAGASGASYSKPSPEKEGGGGLFASST